MKTMDRTEHWLILGLAAVLAYTAFQWGGVERTGRYGILLALGLASLSQAKRVDRVACPPSFSWTALLLPAYVLLQVIPLPLAALRVLSPARAQSWTRWCRSEPARAGPP